MKLFSVYIKKSQNQKLEDLITIDNSFCKASFLFSFFWFLKNKMWKESVIFIISNVILILIFNCLSVADVYIVISEISLLLFVGLNFSHWYEQSLINNNYNFVGYILAKNKDEAKLRFASNFLQDDKSKILFSEILGVEKHKKYQQYFSV